MYSFNKICQLIRNEWSILSAEEYDKLLFREDKNIYIVLKSIIEFFESRKSEIFKYSPWLISRFELVVDSVYKEGRTYVINEAAYLFLTASYLIIDKYQLIQYSKKRGKKITWEQSEQIRGQFISVFTEILRYQYKDQRGIPNTCENDKERFKQSLVAQGLIHEQEDAEKLFSEMIELFEELISKYLYNVLDLDLSLEGMLYKVESLIINSSTSDEEFQQVLEELKRLINLKLKIMKTPPNVL